MSGVRKNTPTQAHTVADRLEPAAVSHRGAVRPVLVLLPALEAFHGLKPNALPRGPPGIGQPAALRVSHLHRPTEPTPQLSGQ